MQCHRTCNKRGRLGDCLPSNFFFSLFFVTIHEIDNNAQNPFPFFLGWFFLFLKKLEVIHYMMRIDLRHFEVIFHSVDRKSFLRLGLDLGWLGIGFMLFYKLAWNSVETFVLKGPRGLWMIIPCCSFHHKVWWKKMWLFITCTD